MPNQSGNAAKHAQDTSQGPWKSWSGMSRHARAIRFMETYCPIPKGVGHGKPIRLGQFQKEFLEEALADGIDAAILSTGRGNGKSTFGGGLACWALYDDDETGAPQVPVIATTIGQAIRSCYGVAVQMVKRSPELMRRSIIYTGIATPRIVVPASGDGELFPVSNDPDGLQGLDPSLAIVDEIGFQPLESWDSVQLAQGKRTRSLAVGVGTPGLNRTNALYHLRSLVREGADLPGLVFREYAAEDGCDVDDREQWLRANPALAEGFLTMESMERVRSRTVEGHFRIFRLGQWVDGTDSWLGPSGRAVWDALLDPFAMVPGAPTWAGVDIGIRHDSSAVAIVQERPDGRLHATVRLWVPTRDEPVDVTDVMQHLRELHAAYDLRAVSYDPRFFDVPAKYLGDEGLSMVEIPQSPERMTAAVGSLYQLVTVRNEAQPRGGLSHDVDAAFSEQVLNAVARYNERGFTLEKRKSRGRIDAAVALALAVDQAQHREPAAPVPTIYIPERSRRSEYARVEMTPEQEQAEIARRVAERDFFPEEDDSPW